MAKACIFESSTSLQWGFPTLGSSTCVSHAAGVLWQELPGSLLPWCSRWRHHVAWRRPAAAASERKTKAVPHWSSAWTTASVWTLGRHVRMRCWPDRLAGTACCSRRCSSSQPLGPGQSRNSCQASRQFGKWKRGRRGRVHLDKVTASSHKSDGGIMQVRSRSRQLKIHSSANSQPSCHHQLGDQVCSSLMLEGGVGSKKGGGDRAAHKQCTLLWAVTPAPDELRPERGSMKDQGALCAWGRT